jgi:hypothetical protein
MTIPLSDAVQLRTFLFLRVNGTNLTIGLCGWFAYLDTSFIQLSWFGEMFDTETATRLAEGTLHAGEDK